VGEAFDKTAKLLGLPYPGGPNVEAAASRGNAQAYRLPRPLLGRAVSAEQNADFSFSGLKTAVRQIVISGEVNAEDVSASFQAAVIEILSDRTAIAMEKFRKDFGRGALVIAGGVAANQAIGARLRRLADEEGFALHVPPPRLCTDNAAMIAWAGLERLAAGDTDTLSASARARWPLTVI
jgi:N6-L-threonylcarbamoyladenine synthase